MIALVVLAPTAAQIVADVQAHYAKLQQQTSTFTQVTTDATFGRTVTSDGTVYVQRPDLVQLDYFPNTKGKTHKQIVVDGKVVWSIDFANKTVQHVPVAANAKLPVALGFLTGASFAKDFELKLVDPTTVELAPKHPSAEVKTLRLVVDRKDSHVITSTIVDAHDNSTAFTFGPPSDAKIPASKFVFDPKQYPGFQIAP